MLRRAQEESKHRRTGEGVPGKQKGPAYQAWDLRDKFAEQQSFHLKHIYIILKMFPNMSNHYFNTSHKCQTVSYQQIQATSSHNTTSTSDLQSPNETGRNHPLPQISGVSVGFSSQLGPVISVGLSSQQFLLTWFESYFMSLLTSGVATKFPANQMYTLQL